MAFTGGTYSIRTALDTSICLDVAGLSSADGVKVQLWSWRIAADQIWDFTSVGSGYYKIVNSSSGKVCTMTPGLINEKRVEQWAYDGGTAEQWEIVDSGQTKTVNGSSFPLYYIKARGTNYVMDAAGEKSAPQTDVLMRAQASTAQNKQLWLLAPTTVLNTSLLAPTSGGVSRYPLKGAVTTLNVPASVNRVYLSWRGSGTRWQCRYRIAVRTPSDATMGNYGNWKCLADGSTVNSGWGAVGTLCPASTVNSRIRDTTGVPITLGTTNDKVVIQFQARRFEPSSMTIGGARFDSRGVVSEFTHSVNANVTVGVSDMVWTPVGVYITPVPSNGRDDNTYKIWINGISKKWRTFAGVANGDYCVIDSDNLKKIPTAGSTYNIQVKLTTIDGAEASATVPVVCSYDADFGLQLDPTITTSGSAKKVNLSAYPTHHVWVVAENEAYEMREDANGVTWIAPPLGVPYHIFIQAEDENGEWGLWSQGYPALPVDMHHLVYEGGRVNLKVNKDDAPLLNASVQTNINASLMTGGTFEAVSAGEGRMESGSLSAVVRYTATEAEAVKDALVEHVFAWYQGVRGQLWRVAIESIDTTQSHPQYAEVTISWRRTDA